MAGSEFQSAREVAFQVLSRFEPRRNYAGRILDEFLPKSDERQRATDLVFGTLRNHTAIDTVIETFSGRRVERIPKKILSIIRVAVFELVYNPQTPDYSIVNEAVENVRNIAGKKQIAFVNAVLREITRHIAHRTAELVAANPKRTLPQNLTTGCEFDMDFMPDIQAEPVEYLNSCFSLPKWLIDNWLNEYGIETATQLCFASNRRPSIYIRPNCLKTSTQQLAQMLAQAGCDVEIVDDERFGASRQGMIKLKGPQAVDGLEGFALGLFSVQDLSACQAVSILRPQAGWKILDLCAAPGSKTTQLAEVTGDSSSIIATDVDSERLEKVKENVTRLGIKSVTIITYNQLFGNSKSAIGCLPTGILGGITAFDAVLLDVPCSNTGVLARRVEARFRLTPDGIEELTRIQTGLLNKAALLVKPGGKICYSTCSIQRAENETQVKEFLGHNPTFQLESEKVILPSAEHFDHDGGYISILQKLPEPGCLS